MAGILFIISAPSGSGKSTLVAQLRSLVEGLEFSVSYTTRAPRGSEIDGREYHFTERHTFEHMIDHGDFLEWAEVFGNYYGTACSALDRAKGAGKDLLLDIDVQGALQVMKKRPQAISIFVLPPSPEVLEMRLRNRSEAEGMTSQENLRRRIGHARTEIRRIWDYKYAIVNDILEHAVAEMRAIVLYERGSRDGVTAVAQNCLTSAHSDQLCSVLKRFGVEC